MARTTAAEPGDSMATVPALIRTARPKQWSKNVLVFAAPAAAGVLDNGEELVKSLVAFAAFCLAASATYFLNDALDAEADRLHPSKKHRPVAAGHVTPELARIMAGLVGLAALAVSFAASWELAVAVAGYLVLTVSYSLWLKHMAVVDLVAVAAGFVLRLVAGGLAVGVPISEWFLIVAGAGSFLMVTGKRHAETLELGGDAGEHRSSLAVYSQQYLLYLRSMSSAVAVVAYCLWAFERGDLSDHAVWYELSIVPFVMGILRYALLLERGEGGAPEDLVLADKALLAIGAAWALSFGIAVYAG